MGMGTGERGWGSRDGDGGAGMGMEERGWDSSPGSGEERMVPCECSVVIVCGNACLASRGKKNSRTRIETFHLGFQCDAFRTILFTTV